MMDGLARRVAFGPTRDRKMTQPSDESPPPELEAPASVAARRALFVAELRAVVRLATPVVLTNLGMMSLGVVDTMMLGRVSEQALAAGALGNSISMGLFMFPMGVLMALDALVSQAHGANDQARVARSCRQGLVLAVLLAIPLSVAMWSLEGVLLFLGQKPEIAAPAAVYLRALIPGAAAFLLFFALRQTLQAMSIVRPALLAMVAANLVNVVANYALVFGHFGFPALGVLGSAYATSLSRWVLLGGVVLAAWPVLRRSLLVRRLAVAPGLLMRMLALGVPIGVQLSLEIWLFVTVALFMGRFGASELAAHQVALNLAALSYMVPMGVGAAAATRVGNAIGRRSLAGARRSAAICIGLGAAVMSLPALAFWLVPEFLSRLFTHAAAVIAVAVKLLPVAALFQVFDGLQVVAVGSLRGSADTRAPAVIALVSFWCLGLPAGWLLAFRVGLGPPGLWWGLTFGLGAVSVLLLVRIRRRFSRPFAGAH